MRLLDSTSVKMWLLEKRVQRVCSAKFYIVSQTLSAENQQIHTRLVSIARRRAKV